MIKHLLFMISIFILGDLNGQDLKLFEKEIFVFENDTLKV